MEFFDNHAHYDDSKFELDREGIITQVYNEGITKLISAGYSLESSKNAYEIAQKHKFIYATAGISPNDIPETYEELEVQLKELEKLINSNRGIGNNKIVAIGEIGLDYYWNTENKELQKQAFIAQIELANKYNLPIVIHTREAIMDTIDILKNKIKTVKPGIFHCCPLNIELVKTAIKLGFYCSFAGPITFKNSKNTAEIISLVPLNKILIETDTPYLSPEPKRGTRNDSRNVKFVAEKIAEIKGISIGEAANVTYQNAKRAYNIE